MKQSIKKGQILLIMLLSFATVFCQIKPNSLNSKVSYWVTNPNAGIYLKKQTTTLNFSTALNSNPTIIVDSTMQFQTMDGFGFAMTGGSAYLINSLASDSRSGLLKELFSNDSTSIGISYLRISIGASDLN